MKEGAEKKKNGISPCGLCKDVSAGIIMSDDLLVSLQRAREKKPPFVKD